ncbi:MAG TPA: hypothetical protein VF933_16815 [Streptosporangiaceae bacterium]
MNRTPPPDAAALATALRACADGFHPAEAAMELLVRNASWLRREDFRDGYAHVCYASFAMSISRRRS